MALPGNVFCADGGAYAIPLGPSCRALLQMGPPCNVARNPCH